MVKSEIITDTSSRGSVASTLQSRLTPGVVSAIAIAVAVAVLLLIALQRQTQPASPATTAATPAAANEPLTVQPPVTDGVNQAATTSGDVQAATGTSSDAVNGQAPLNSTGVTPDGGQSASFNQQSSQQNLN